MRYSDCCRIPLQKGQKVIGFAAGVDNTALVLTDVGGAGSLELLRNYKSVAAVPIGGAAAARRLIWASSAKTAILAGDVTTGLITFNGTKTEEKSLKCTLPATVDEAGRLLACVSSESRNVELFDARTGKLIRDFASPEGPLQTIYVGGDIVAAVGAYPSRAEVLVSIWDRRSGEQLSRRTCPAGGVHSPTVVELVSRGNYFSQPQLRNAVENRDVLTCEVRSVVRFPNDTVADLKAASASDLEVALSSQPGSVNVINSAAPDAVYRWDLGQAIDDFSVSPDGRNAMFLVGDHLFQVPLDDADVFDQ